MWCAHNNKTKQTITCYHREIVCNNVATGCWSRHTFMKRFSKTHFHALTIAHCIGFQFPSRWVQLPFCTAAWSTVNIFLIIFFKYYYSKKSCEQWSKADSDYEQSAAIMQTCASRHIGTRTCIVCGDPDWSRPSERRCAVARLRRVQSHNKSLSDTLSHACGIAPRSRAHLVRVVRQFMQGLVSGWTRTLET